MAQRRSRRQILNHTVTTRNFVNPHFSLVIGKTPNALTPESPNPALLQLSTRQIPGQSDWRQPKTARRSSESAEGARAGLPAPGYNTEQANKERQLASSLTHTHTLPSHPSKDSGCQGARATKPGLLSCPGEIGHVGA